MAQTRSRSIFGAVFFSAVSLACFVYCFASVFKLALFLSTDLLGKDALKGQPDSTQDQQDGEGSFLSNPLVQDVGLLLLFPLQHLLMSSWLVRRLLSALRLDIVERSLYVASTGLVLQVAIDNWKAVGESDPFWDFPVRTNPFLWLVFTLVHIFGWMSISGSAVILDYPEMMGVKQAYYYALGLDEPLSIKSESVRQFYSNNRLPIFTGVMMVLWLIPCMTLDRLVLAGVWTLYLLLWQNLSVHDYVYMCVMLDRKREEIRTRLPMPTVLFFLLRTSLIVVALASVAVVLYLITCLYMWLLIPIVILSVFTLIALLRGIHHAIASESAGLSTYLAESFVVVVSAAALYLGVLYSQFWPAFFAGVAQLWCVARSYGVSLSTQAIVLLLSGGAAVYLGVYYQLWWAAVWVGISMLVFVADQAGVSFKGSTSPAAIALTLASVGSALLGYLYGIWIPAAVVAAVVALLLLRQFAVRSPGVSLRAVSLPLAAIITLLLLTALVASVAVGVLYSDWIPAGIAGVLAAGVLAKQHGPTSMPVVSSKAVILLLTAASSMAIGVLYSQWIPAAAVAVVAAGSVAQQRQWVSLPETSSGGLSLPLLLLAAVVGTVAVGVMYALWVPAAIVGALLALYALYRLSQLISLPSASAVCSKTVLQPLLLLLSAAGSVAVGVMYLQWIPLAVVLALATLYAHHQLIPSVSTKNVVIPLLLLYSAAGSVAAWLMYMQWIPAAVVGALTILYAAYRLIPSVSSVAVRNIAFPLLLLHCVVGSIAAGLMYSQWIPAALVGVHLILYAVYRLVPSLSSGPAENTVLPFVLIHSATASVAVGVLTGHWIPAAVVGVLTTMYIIYRLQQSVSLGATSSASFKAALLPLVLLASVAAAVAGGILYAQWIPAGVVGVLAVAYLAHRFNILASLPSAKVALPPLALLLALVGSVLAGVWYSQWIPAGIVGSLVLAYFLKNSGLLSSLPKIPAASGGGFLMPITLLLMAAGISGAVWVLYSQWIPAAVVGALATSYFIKQSGALGKLPAVSARGFLMPLTLLLAAGTSAAVWVLYSQWIPAAVVGALATAYFVKQSGALGKLPAVSARGLLKPLTLLMAAGSSAALWILYSQWIPAAVLGVLITAYFIKQSGALEKLPAVSMPSRALLLPSVLLIAAASSVAVGVLYAQWIPAAVAGVGAVGYVVSKRGGLSLPPLSSASLLQTVQAAMHVLLPLGAIALGVLYELWIPAAIVGIMFILHGAHHYGLTPTLPTISTVPFIPLLLLSAIAGSIAAGILYNTWIPAGFAGGITAGYLVKRSGLISSLPSPSKPSLSGLSAVPKTAVVLLLAAASAIAAGVLYAQWIPAGIVGILTLAYAANQRGLFQSVPSVSLPPLSSIPYRAVSLGLGAASSLALGVLYAQWIPAGILAGVVTAYLALKYLLPVASQTSLPSVPRGGVILLLGAAVALAAGILYAQWIPAAVVGGLTAVLAIGKLWPSLPSFAAIPRPSLSAPSLAAGSLTLGTAASVAVGILYAQWIPLGVVAALGVAYMLGQKWVFARLPTVTSSMSISRDVLVLVLATIASLLLGYFYDQWWSALAAAVAIVWYMAKLMGISASLPNLTLSKPSLPKLTFSRSLAEVIVLSAATVSSVLLGVLYAQWIPLACSGVAITWFILRNKGVQVSLPSSLQLDPLAQSLIATAAIFLALAILFEAWNTVWATLVALVVIVVSKSSSLISYVKSIKVRAHLSALGTRLREANACASTMDVLGGGLWYERLSRYAVVGGMVLACLTIAWRFSVLEMSVVLVALLLISQVADHYRWGMSGIRVPAEQETQ